MLPRYAHVQSVCPTSGSESEAGGVEGEGEVGRLEKRAKERRVEARLCAGMVGEGEGEGEMVDAEEQKEDRGRVTEKV